MIFIVNDLRFGGDIKTFLDKYGQVNEGYVGRALRLEWLEEYLGSEEGEGLINNIITIALQFRSRSIDLGFQRTKTNPAGCFNGGIFGKRWMIRH